MYRFDTEAGCSTGLARCVGGDVSPMISTTGFSLGSWHGVCYISVIKITGLKTGDRTMLKMIRKLDDKGMLLWLLIGMLAVITWTL